MKALVTGDRGLVGSSMVRELKDRGYEVYGMDIKDGADYDAIDYFRSTTETGFDLLVHAAYVVGGREHIDGRNMAFASNVQLDGAMFEWSLRSSVGAVLYYSSSAAYPERLQSRSFAPRRLIESDIDRLAMEQPDSNYGWAKLTGERLAYLYSLCGGRVHVVRPFSGYATSQDLSYPFPAIVKRVLQGDMTVWGPPGQTRDWIHMDDVINASLEIVNQDVRHPVNLCTGRPTEFGELAKLIVGTDDVTVNYLTDKPTGVLYRVGDPTEMLKYYEPKISLEEGIDRALKEAS